MGKGMAGMADSIQIVVRDTPEKFQGLAEEIVRPLLEVLRRRNGLERETCARSDQLQKEKAAAGVSLNLTIPAERELWGEYRRRYLEIVKPFCLPDFLKYGAARSFGKPARYDYIFDTPEAKVYFTMKSAKRAVVETIAQRSFDTRYRFVLRPDGDGWKVGAVDYAFGNDTDWHVDHSL